MRGFGDYDCDGTASALKARDYKDATDLITYGFQSTANGNEAGSPGWNISPTLRAADPMAVAFAENQQADVYEMNVTHSLSTGGGKPGQGYPALRQGYGVRRLTPVECERLQGFPDEYTRVAWKGRGSEACPDSVRYKALGNSMAVPVMHWIGSRIADVERSYA
jgi:DNA (cytosine-5)-methyltransferase 1